MERTKKRRVATDFTVASQVKILKKKEKNSTDNVCEEDVSSKINNMEDYLFFFPFLYSPGVIGVRGGHTRRIEENYICTPRH